MERGTAEREQIISYVPRCRPVQASQGGAYAVGSGTKGIFRVRENLAVAVPTLTVCMRPSVDCTVRKGQLATNSKHALSKQALNAVWAHCTHTYSTETAYDLERDCGPWRLARAKGGSLECNIAYHL